MPWGGSLLALRERVLCGAGAMRALAVVVVPLLIAGLLGLLSRGGVRLRMGPLVAREGSSGSGLPYYLGDPPERLMASYGEEVPSAPHTVEGPGLHEASTGERASFTIRLAKAKQKGESLPPPRAWNVQDGRFFYVWIAGEDQVVAAEVVNNMDGTLTASYTVDFPGSYSVNVEAIDLKDGLHGHTKPLRGSPFELTVTGRPAFDPDALPTCGSDADAPAQDRFWRKGSWVSGNVASYEHGALRNGWVYQPEACAYDVFSNTDLLAMASLEEPTWLMVLGGSVQRGVFLTLIDLVLVKGQKDELFRSVLQKCWGYADVRVGNLRLTYQDMRFWNTQSRQDVIVCNNEKLVLNSTGPYVEKAESFLREYVFTDGAHWPDVILGASWLASWMDATNFGVEVPLKALPPDWNGELMMMENMATVGYHWQTANPTRHSLAGVRPSYRRKKQISTPKGLTEVMEGYMKRDHRVSFMSVIPLMQPVYWESEYLKEQNGACYTCSQHYHYVTKPTDPRSLNATRLVHSMVLEMLANVMVGKAVGTKKALHKKATALPDIYDRIEALKSAPFQVCEDCPDNLIPFHIKHPPAPRCTNVTALEIDTVAHEVWDKEACPGWCKSTPVISKTPTQSGAVDVRECLRRNT